MFNSKFNTLKTTVIKNKSLPISNRIEKLKRLLSWIEDNENNIVKALYLDFKKSEFETFATEINVLKSELHFFIKNTKRWTKTLRVKTPTLLLGHKSSIRYEPKGVVLIISPWNYPFQLTISPLIPAIAAGNCVVLKPSELTPNTSRLIHQLVNDVFSPESVLCELGGKEKTEELLTYNFDHVFFTGSTEVGRLIAKSCSNNLIPYTLELGGKSPTIIDQTADIQNAAEKIFWGKFLNRGQTCVAPDYVIIHHAVKDKFINALQDLERHCKETPTGYINSTHQKRISIFANNLIDIDAIKCKVIDSPELTSEIMKQEIFGPLLPVLPYSDSSDIFKIINQNPNPLALYIFSNTKSFINLILENSQSGGVAINNVIVQLANPYLPFGGLRTSGVGAYHGHRGFMEFSHQRSIIEHKYFFKSMKLVFPPYTNFKKKLLKRL